MLNRLLHSNPMHFPSSPPTLVSVRSALLLTVVTVGLLAFSIRPASGQVPVRIPDVAGEAGTDVTIPIAVDSLNEKSVTAYEFALPFDSSVVDITGVDISDTVTPSMPTVNVEDGVVQVAFSTTEPLGGDGPLLTLQATLTGAGTDRLTFRSLQFFDQDGNEVASESRGGLVTSTATITGRIPDTSATDGQEVLLPIQIDSLAGADITAYEFTLPFDTSVADVTGVDVSGTVTPSAPTVNRTDGELRVAYSGAEALSGDGPLLRISTQLVAPGSDVFSLEDVQFFNSDAESVAAAFDSGIVTVEGTTAGVDVRIPDVKGDAGQAVTIPIRTDALDGENVTAYQFTLPFDSSVLDVTGVDTSGTLTSSAPVVNMEANEIRVSFSAAQPLSGSGPLLKLRGELVSGGERVLDFSNVQLFDRNAAEVSTTPVPGRVTVRAPSASSTEPVQDDGETNFQGTGTSINFSGVSGSGEVTVRKFSDPPADTTGITEDSVSGTRYVISSSGDLSLGEETEARFDTSALANLSNPTAVTVYQRDSVGRGSFSPLPTEFDEATGELVASLSSFSEFAFASSSAPPAIAVNPTSLSETLALGDSSTQTIRIENTATGDTVQALNVRVVVTEAGQNTSTRRKGRIDHRGTAAPKVSARVNPYENRTETGASRDGRSATARGEVALNNAGAPKANGSGALFGLAPPDTAAEFDPETGGLLRDFSTPDGVSGGPDGLAFDGSTLIFYNDFGRQTFYRIDPADGTVVDSVARADIGSLQGKSIDALAHNGTFLYALNFPNDTIYEVDLENRRVVGSITPGEPLIGGLTFGGSRQTLFVSDFGSAVYEVSIETGEVLNQWTPPEEVLGLGYSEARGTLFATGSVSQTVYELDPETGTQLNTFATASLFTGLAADEAAGVEWLSVRPRQAEVGPGEAQDLTARFTSTSTPPGLQEATLRITSNDPDQDTVNVPVSLTVERPPITLSGPDEAPAPGTEATVDLTFPAVFTPTAGTFFFRRAGARSFQGTPLEVSGLEPGTEGTVSATIPDSVVTEDGVQYYVQARGSLPSGRDTVELNVPGTAPSRTAFLPVQLAEAAAEGTFEPETYDLLTVPLELGDRSVFDVLENQFGSPDPGVWRAARWDPDEEAYAFGRSAAEDVRPGEALWLITAAGDSLTIENGAQSADASGPRSISLQPGWNQIGSPFLFPVAWDEVVRPESIREPVTYDTTGYNFGVGTLRPWQGAFVFNGADSSVAVEVPPLAGQESDATASALAKAPGAGGGYRLQPVARAYRNGRTLTDRATRLGFAEGAKAGFGPKDRPKPPAIGSGVRLHVTPEEGPALAQSLKPPASTGAAWTLRLGLSLDEPLRSPQQVTIALNEQGPRPEGFQRYVIDRDQGRRLPVTNQSVTVNLTKDRPARDLRVIVGTEAFAQKQAEGASLAIDETKLRPNAPNPFTESTTIAYQLAEEKQVRIAIYDLLGRQVETLINETQRPGVHEIEWRPGEAGGSSLASGVYFCRMEAGSYSEARKLVLVR